MTTLVRLALDVVLSLVLPFLVQLADKRWLLTEEQRSGAWNSASWGAAIYNFGPFSMTGWVVVTRHKWDRWRDHGGYVEAVAASIGLGVVGLLCSAPILAVMWGLDQLAALALGLPP